MLATLADLAAIGAVPMNQTATDGPYGIRGTRLLEMASAQVCAYLGVEEADLLPSLTAAQAMSLAAIVAEAAGARLNVSAAPSTDPYASATGPASAMLTRWHFRQLDTLVGRPGRSNASTVVQRDVNSSWLTSPGVSCVQPDDGPGWTTIAVYPS